MYVCKYISTNDHIKLITIIKIMSNLNIHQEVDVNDSEQRSHVY